MDDVRESTVTIVAAFSTAWSIKKRKSTGKYNRRTKF